MLKEKHLKLFAESENQKCRYCNQNVTADTVTLTYSYWRGFLFFCHEECKKAGEAEERLSCQIIDADCNDCFFFQRGAVISKGVSEGHCLKFDKPTLAYPVFASGHSCFEHRNRVTAQEVQSRD